MVAKDHGAAHTLKHAEKDQLLFRLGHPAQSGADYGHANARGEDPFSPQVIAQTARREEQGSDNQQLRGYNPLNRGEVRS